ncbi:hypothetical protein Daus18300_011657 [Diaporthe australafricana]|uniref:Uncharacterized protein n=1 Tax=Diaporthe australafricana TaxID=127596 RepID=A0ABR3W5M0_9PEZI
MESSLLKETWTSFSILMSTTATSNVVSSAAGKNTLAIVKDFKFKAIMLANASDPKSGNGSLHDQKDHNQEFEKAVGVSRMSLKRHKSSNRENKFFMECMQGLVRERLELELENLESGEDHSTVLQDTSGNKQSGQPTLGQCWRNFEQFSRPISWEARPQNR